MKKWVLICFGLAISFNSYSQQINGANSIIGKWKNDGGDKEIQMQIYAMKDNSYYGSIINDKSTPTKNGTILLKALKYDAFTRMYKGTMQPPDAKLELTVTVAFEADNRLKLVAKKFFMIKTLYLTKQ
ncbi:hypothetical protein [Parasediminibacterium sp. JCM 36343]|uniref:hypothetical protein n=1 Tax=Parasediminibacterium sp. JCM 36343 TaxID=3374279 RepID=UPI00397E0B55